MRSPADATSLDDLLTILNSLKSDQECWRTDDLPTFGGVPAIDHAISWDEHSVIFDTPTLPGRDRYEIVSRSLLG